jgi:hypothetical protein
MRFIRLVHRDHNHNVRVKTPIDRDVAIPMLRTLLELGYEVVSVPEGAVRS